MLLMQTGISIIIIISTYELCPYDAIIIIVASAAIITPL